MEELSTGKVTVKFLIKFILWTILFFIIGAIIVGIISGGAIMEIADSDMNSIDDMQDMFGAINGFIYGLVVVDIVVALLATKLSTGGIAKKTKITAESRKRYMKGIAIVLAVIAVLVIIVHSVIVGAVDGLIVEDIDDANNLGDVIELAEDESDDFGRVFGIDAQDEYEEAVDLLKGLNTAGHIYSISGVVFACMIPLANIFLKKKEVQE